jgi:small subunit ribosomal protein S1
VKKEKKAERDKTRDQVKQQQDKIEKDTLGDLDVFNQLKDQMSEDETQA